MLAGPMREEVRLKAQLDAEKEWKPMRALWTLQREVVDAAVEALERADVQLNDVVQVIHQHEAVHTSLLNVKETVRNSIKDRYKTTFENGGREKLLADLRRQSDWLVQQKDGISPTFIVDPEIRSEIARRNGEYARTYDTEVADG